MGIEINKKLLPMKGQYFLFNAGTAPVVPFLTTYAKQLGFSSFVVGTIYTILPVTGMLAKPLFGAIADRFQLKKAIFISFQLLTALSFLSILYVPESEQHAKMLFDCGSGASFLKHCPEPDSMHNCAIDFIDTDIFNGIMNCKVNCPMTSELWETVCLHWKLDANCHMNSTRNLIFNAEVLLNYTLKIENCINFKVKKIFMMNGNKSVSYCPKDNHTHLFHPLCEVQCNSAIVHDLISDSTIDDSEVFSMYQFWLFFSLLVSSWIGMAVVVSVGDAICFGILGDQPQKYGNQRLWGAVGWGTFSVLSGLIVDKMSGEQSQKDYSAVFYLAFVMLLLCTLVSNHLKYNQNTASVSIIRDTGKLLKRPRIAVFCVWCISVGLCTGLLWNFLFWHLEDLAVQFEGCSTILWMKTLQGLVLGIQCFGGEIPFFFLSGWIINKISHIHAMSLVLLALSIRLLLYSFLTNPWWVLPIELLQGLTFGLFYSTMASYASIVAPPGTEATVQGLVGAIFEGIGVSLGSLLGGYLMTAIGGAATFQTFGSGALVLCLLHVLVQFLLKRKNLDDITTNARYALPNDAIHMLSSQETLSHT